MYFGEVTTDGSFFISKQRNLEHLPIRRLNGSPEDGMFWFLLNQQLLSILNVVMIRSGEVATRETSLTLTSNIAFYLQLAFPHHESFSPPCSTRINAPGTSHSGQLAQGSGDRRLPPALRREKSKACMHSAAGRWWGAWRWSIGIRYVNKSNRGFRR